MTHTPDTHPATEAAGWQSAAPEYSVVVPVYNRPDEVDELLDSLTRQRMRNFEVVIVEDGSQLTCQEVCGRYADRLDISYFMKPNSGPGQSRNYGVERARGRYVLILDSDVIVPEEWLEAIDQELRCDPCEAFGGPDRAHQSFTPTQKAISYSMTSFFTTGGIRGGKKKLDKFYPRSFNMGIRRDVYTQLGGFSPMRFGEDIDFSIRIFKAGCKCRLFPAAWVYHKRRTDFRKFWRQVYNSGIARINLYKRYPESLKLVHLLPAVFTAGVAVLVLLMLAGLSMLCLGTTHMQHAFGVAALGVGGGLLVLYALLIAVSATVQTRSLRVGQLSVVAAFTQLMGYGCGFFEAVWKRMVKRQDEFHAYDKTFYK